MKRMGFDPHGSIELSYMCDEENGSTYYYINGNKCKGEVKINNYWYFFDRETGAMQTGFVDLSQKRVYYNSDGRMQKGEKRIEGFWY